jgi:hypothetical protein
MFRSTVCLLLATLALAACGKAPGQTDTVARGFEQPAGTVPAASPVAPATAPLGAAPEGVDTRVTAALTAAQRLRDGSGSADCVLMLHYIKDDGTKPWIRSHYKYQKPQHNALELLSSSESKVEGTQLVWTGGGKVQVHTKFIGFWLNISLDLQDDRLKDAVGYRIDQTAINKVFDTLLCPQNKVTYLADGNLKGRPMWVLNVVSPLSLAPATREVFGIEKSSGTPIVREMYKGDKAYFRMELESNKLNPHFTSADFTTQ